MSTISELASPKTSMRGVWPLLYTHPSKPHRTAASALYFSACLGMPVPNDSTRNLLLSNASISTYSESPANIPFEIWDIAISVCQLNI